MTENIPLGWAYLPVAFALGGLHILEPGHGKALASAYLVSGKHGWKDAVVLGISTTASHTSLVIAMAAASLWAQGHYPAAEIEAHVRSFGAGALILLGAYSCVRAVRSLRHGHHHGHSHAHEHGQARGTADSLWAVALVGFSNGFIPCPGALAALGVALSLGQVALGLITVLTYSAGMALALSLLALLIIEAGQRAQRWLPSDRAALWMPLISGVLIVLTGLWLLAAPVHP
jgi:ABC-type nickel/cobalt efflux system permease component RcnA